MLMSSWTDTIPAAWWTTLDVGVRARPRRHRSRLSLEVENGPGDHIGHDEGVRVLLVTQGTRAVTEHVEGADARRADSYGETEDGPCPRARGPPG